MVQRWQIEELENLRRIYAEGLVSGRWADRSAQFGSREDLRQRIDELERDLGVIEKGHRRRVVVVDRRLS